MSLHWVSSIDRLKLAEWRAVGWPTIVVALDRELRGSHSGNSRLKGRTILMNCCFHEERTPSLKLYPNGGFTCYGCLQSGGIPDFVAVLLGMEDASELDSFFDDLMCVVSLHPQQLQLPV